MFIFLEDISHPDFSFVVLSVIAGILIAVFVRKYRGKIIVFLLFYILGMGIILFLVDLSFFP